ncbi:MAG: hypothetical protein KIS74_02850, partial [Burkholderiales bacterium]|nr:hypothetical protein [Burkholderiales bacterium]
TCLERRGPDGLLQTYEVITWEDGTMAYWSHEGRCWRAATNIPDYHAIREAWQAVQPRTSTITEEPNGPHD